MGFSDIGDSGKRYIRVDGTDIMIHNLTVYPTKDAAISAIREVPGIYAWYETLFPFDEQKPNDSIIDGMKALVMKDNFPKNHDMRTIQPIMDYKLEIKSYNSWGDTLQNSLSHYLQFDEVKTNINQILLISLLLQPPLYIGCSINLRDRVSKHLDLKTGFAERYYDNTKCKPMTLRLVTLPINFNDEYDGNQNVEGVKPLVDTIEDLFSRLYKPQWNKRYG